LKSNVWLYVAILALISCRDAREPAEQPTPMPGPTPFVYPTELWDLKVQGETMLMVRVTELGAVDSAYVVSSSGFREFDSAAVRGVHQLRFSPGRQGQRRIPMWTKVPVRFSLDSLPTVGLPPPRNGAHD
jgi:TonB family protein